MSEPITDVAQLEPGVSTAPCRTTMQLVILLGEEPGSFTHELLMLLQRFPYEGQRLGIAYPLAVTVFNAWERHPDPTHGDVVNMIRAARLVQIRHGGSL